MPLNWRMPPGELDKLLEDCSTRLLFYRVGDAAAAAAIKSLSESIGLDYG